MKRLRISSAQNPRLKQAAGLRRRRSRRKQNRILVDGQRAIRCALSAGVELQEIFLPADRMADMSETDRQLMRLCEQAQIELIEVPDKLLAQIGYAARSDQWVATATPPACRLESLNLSGSPIVAIMQGVQKPGNLGAVLRSADAAGVDALIVADGEIDLHNPNAIRASQGTIFTLPLCECTTDEVIAWLRQSSLTAFVARVDGAIDYDQCDLTGGVAIVLGCEAEGVSPTWLTDEWQGLRLPMMGQADSLNVSTTAAVIFYEARRQRRSLPRS